VFSNGRFHPGDRGLRRSDPFRQFGLRETGFRARFQDFVQQLEFFREVVVLITHPWLCQGAGFEFLKFGFLRFEVFEAAAHQLISRFISRIRRRAISSSFRGVFSDFLMLLPQHHDSATAARAIEHPCDTAGSLQSQLEQTLAQCSRARHAGIGSECLHPLRISEKSRHESRWMLKNLLLQRDAIEREAPAHASPVIADMLCRIIAFWRQDWKVSWRRAVDENLGKSHVLILRRSADLRNFHKSADFAQNDV
jgi:hypothetical protein